MSIFHAVDQPELNSDFGRYIKNTRELIPRVFFNGLKLTLRFLRGSGRAGAGSFFARTWQRYWAGPARLVQNGDHVVSEIDAVARIQEHFHAVKTVAGLIEDQIEIHRLHFICHHAFDLIDDAFAHAQRLLLKLALARLPKLGDLALHVLDV